MGFSVKGKYFETCNCDVSCPCIWLGPATNDSCDVLLAWHVSEGQRDGVDLSGLNAVMAVHTLKQMTDGNWKVALYLDDRATPEQSEALGAVFSGGAGGHLAGGDQPHLDPRRTDPSQHSRSRDHLPPDWHANGPCRRH